MSTYLVAFIVSDLVNTNASHELAQPTRLPVINVWARKNVASMTKYTMNINQMANKMVR